MINKLGQVMVYVNDQDQAVKFWTEKAGFRVVAEEDNGGGFRWIEVAPTEASETSIILHNKEFIAKMSPDLNLGTPSLMFFTDNLDDLYQKFTSVNMTVGEIVSMPGGRVFNFADDEDNYFAVIEKE
jgi:lactoylglutathione lyase